MTVPDRSSVAVADGNGHGQRSDSWPVIGHEEIIGSLRRSLARNQVSHAYLVAGPEGVGKATVARVFAQALCCQGTGRPDATVPCGTCLSCRKVGRGVHPDVQVLDLETQARLGQKRPTKQTSLTIDSIRQVAVDAALKPMEASRRVIVIDDAEAMQEVAQEALLKTLEEPPPCVLMLLLATDAGMLLPTIQSRCRVLQARPVPRSVIAQALARTGIEPATADEIAAMASGRPGWALRAATDQALVEARRAATDRALSWIEGSTYARLVTAVRLGDSFAKRRPDVLADLETVLAVWRDVMLLRANSPEFVTHRSALDRLAALAPRWSLESITRSARAAQRCLTDLDGNVRPRLALESMVLQWPANVDRVCAMGVSHTTCSE